MSYILIDIDSIGEAYQQVDINGDVVQYMALDGTPLFTMVPVGLWSWVVDANPPTQSWM